MIDCLIVGFNDMSFSDYVNMLGSMGKDSGAYRDSNLDFIWHDGKPYRSMDILNHFYFQDKEEFTPFHNADFIWPVVLYLGTYLSRRGLSFDYVNLFHLEKEKLREKLVHNDILAIAITTTMYVIPHPILEIMSFIREYNETAKVIVGGPYILSQVMMLNRAEVERLFAYIGADFYVISSEGELALTNIIHALKDDKSFDDIDNIAYRRGKQGKYVFTATSREANSLEKNMVDYGLFPKEEFGEFVSLRLSKSCPFSCAFCNYPVKGGEYRNLDIEFVERELDAIRDIGTITTLTFVDDTINVPRKRFKEILRMMIRNRYAFEWNCQYRCDHGDAETIELMKEAGCTGIFLGIESGSDQVLEVMNKTARRKDFLKAIPKFREVGILTHASFIVGFPGETYGSVRQTIEIIEETKPDFFRPQLWYCDPIAPIWKKRKEYGIRGSAYEWQHNTMDASTACDLLEKMLLTISNSIWLPENGFDMWSVFYLQRKGMTLEQIKSFLRCFNAVVKDKLLNPIRETIAADLQTSLIKSCRFSDSEQPDMHPVQLLSGASYVAAENFLVREFGDRSLVPSIDLLCDESEMTDDEQSCVPWILEKPMLDSLRAGYPNGLADVFLAAYSSLLSRLSGREDIVVVSSIGRRGPVPLRLRLSWDLCFEELVSSIRETTLQAAKCQRYAFRILTNPLRMAEYGAVCPILDTGYVYRRSGEEQPASDLVSLMEMYPTIKRDMVLSLDVIEADDSVHMQFLHRQGLWKQGAVHRLRSYLVAILEQVGTNPNIFLGDIELDEAREEKQELAIDIGMNEAFDFRGS